MHDQITLFALGYDFFLVFEYYDSLTFSILIASRQSMHLFS